MLREAKRGYWLAGMIFADGTGHASDFAAWADALATRLSDQSSEGNDCAEAWGACKQSERRGALAAKLESVREGLRWLEGVWHEDWYRRAHLEVAPAPALVTLDSPVASARSVAWSRVLMGGAASWPDAREFALLRLWPSARGQLGIRLQTAICLGAQASEVRAMLPAFLTRSTRSWSPEDRAVAIDIGWDFGPGFVQYFGPGFVRDFGRYIVRYYGRDFGRRFNRYFVRDLGRSFVQNFGQNFVRNFDRSFHRDFARRFARDSFGPFSKDFAPHFPQYFGQYFGLDESLADQPWWPWFSLLELSSTLGRSAPRAALPHGKIPDGVPLLTLFRATCRASFAPDDEHLRAAVSTACNAFDGDPLWPALIGEILSSILDEDRPLR